MITKKELQCDLIDKSPNGKATRIHWYKYYTSIDWYTWEAACVAKFKQKYPYIRILKTGQVLYNGMPDELGRAIQPAEIWIDIPVQSVEDIAIRKVATKYGLSPDNPLAKELYRLRK